jgi:putative aldouronate transport system permease protein
MVVKFNKEIILDRSVDIMIYGFLLVIAFLTLFPFWYCLVGSLNEGTDYFKGGVFFWPRKFTLANYFVVLQDKSILSAYWVTILRTFVGTITHILFTSVFAYAYSRKILRWKPFFMYVCMIPMFFGGGLIPRYILYRELGLINNFLVYIIPGLFSFWNVIILQANFRGIPDALIESATIDGAGEYTIYWRIIMPLSKPVLAAIALFTAVGHWNSYFDSMVFTKSAWLQTIQVYLIKLIKSRELAASMAMDTSLNMEDTVTSETIQLATMMVVTIPIIFVYPFLQKYFVKGMLIGSVKG